MNNRYSNESYIKAGIIGSVFGGAIGLFSERSADRIAHSNNLAYEAAKLAALRMLSELDLSDVGRKSLEEVAFSAAKEGAISVGVPATYANIAAFHVRKAFKRLTLNASTVVEIASTAAAQTARNTHPEITTIGGIFGGITAGVLFLWITHKLYDYLYPDNADDKKLIAALTREERRLLSEIANREQDDSIDMELMDSGEEIPDEFLCPISSTIMRDPVKINDGHIFNRRSITYWYEKSIEEGRQPVCPKDRSIISKNPMFLPTEHILQERIQQYLSERNSSQIRSNKLR